MDLGKWLQENWTTIAPAVWQFVTFGLIAFGAGWAYGRFGFGERIETLKGRIEARDETITALEKGQQFDAHERIAELEARVVALASARQIPPEKIAALVDALRAMPTAGINLIRDSGNPESWQVFVQVRSAFYSTRWAVFEDYYLGPVPGSRTGIMLRRFPGFEAVLEPVSQAFDKAGIAYEYVEMPAPPPHGRYIAEILFSHVL